MLRDEKDKNVQLEQKKDPNSLQKGLSIMMKLASYGRVPEGNLPREAGYLTAPGPLKKIASFLGGAESAALLSALSEDMELNLRILDKNLKESKINDVAMQIHTLLPIFIKIEIITDKINQFETAIAIEIQKQNGAESLAIQIQKKRLAKMKAKIQLYSPIISDMTRLFHVECIRRLRVLKQFIDSYNRNTTDGVPFSLQSDTGNTVFDSKKIDDVIKSNQCLLTYYKTTDNCSDEIKVNKQIANSDGKPDPNVPVVERLADLWGLHLILLSNISDPCTNCVYPTIRLDLIPMFCEHDRVRAKSLFKTHLKNAQSSSQWDEIFKYLESGVLLSQNEFNQLVDKWIDKCPSTGYRDKEFFVPPIPPAGFQPVVFFSPIAASEKMKPYFEAKESIERVKKMIKTHHFLMAAYFIQNGTPYQISEIALVLKQALRLDDIIKSVFCKPELLLPFNRGLHHLFKQVPKLLDEFSLEDKQKLLGISLIVAYGEAYPLTQFLLELKVPLTKDHLIIHNLNIIASDNKPKNRGIVEALLKHPDCDAKWVAELLKDPGFYNNYWKQVVSQFKELCSKDYKHAAELAVSVTALPHERSHDYPYSYFSDLQDLINADPTDNKPWVNHCFNVAGIELNYLMEAIRLNYKHIIKLLMPLYQDKTPFAKMRKYYPEGILECLTPLHYKVYSSVFRDRYDDIAVFKLLLEEKMSDQWLEREEKNHNNNLVFELVEKGNLEFLEALFNRTRGVSKNLINIRVNPYLIEDTLLTIILRKIKIASPRPNYQTQKVEVDPEIIANNNRYVKIAMLLIQHGIDFISDNLTKILSLEKHYPELVHAVIKRDKVLELLSEQYPLSLVTRSEILLDQVLKQKTPQQLMACRDYSIKTLLFAAVEVQDIKKLNNILNHIGKENIKAIINERNVYGITALEVALNYCWNGYSIDKNMLEIVSLLIEHGADKSIVQWALKNSSEAWDYINVLKSCKPGEKLFYQQCRYHLGLAMIKQDQKFILLLLKHMKPNQTLENIKKRSALCSAAYADARKTAQLTDTKKALDAKVAVYMKQAQQPQLLASALLKEIPCETILSVPSTWNRNRPETKKAIAMLTVQLEKKEISLQENRQIIATEIGDYINWATEPKQEVDQVYLSRLIYIYENILSPCTVVSSESKEMKEADKPIPLLEERPLVLWRNARSQAKEIKEIKSENEKLSLSFLIAIGSIEDIILQKHSGIFAKLEDAPLVAALRELQASINALHKSNEANKLEKLFALLEKFAPWPTLVKSIQDCLQGVGLIPKIDIPVARNADQPSADVSKRP